MYTVYMLYEMRTYEIPNQNRRVFHERFEKHAMRLMEKHGFKVVGAWDEAIGHQQEFHYLLSWKDLNTRQASWVALNSDEEWSAIKKEYNDKYGEMVLHNYSRILKPTSYSPIK